jgi:hypothetical protein
MVLAASTPDLSDVVVMDCDGEDRPEDVVALVQKANSVDAGIVCAQRTKRSEALSFKIFYAFYKFIFRLMTGKVIDFGNFMLIKKGSLISLVHHPSLWNHLAATVVQSRVPIERLATQRGKRFFGKSKMNFVSLLIHGLSAISAFFDVFLVRLLFGIGIVMFGAFVATLAVVLIRLFTELAIPGWATTAAGFALVVFIVSLLMGSLAVLGLLSSRSTLQTVPVADARRFLAERVTVYP